MIDSPREGCQNTVGARNPSLAPFTLGQAGSRARLLRPVCNAAWRAVAGAGGDIRVARPERSPAGLVLPHSTLHAQNGPPVRRSVRSAAPQLAATDPAEVEPGAGAQPLSTKESTIPNRMMLCMLCTAMPMSALR